MSSRLRVLLLTPDYPPVRGGIQYLLHGLVHHAEQVDYRVVTLGDRQDAVEDRVVTRRVVARGPRPGVLAALSVASVVEACRWRPDVVLCGHIVLAPAARLTGRPVVQYLYASEMASRPRLTAHATRHAVASIVLGAHGRSLALTAGADERRIHVIAPGIDLPPRSSTRPRDRPPSIVNIARLEDRYKGFDVLIRALPLVRSRVPDATLTLIGEGHLRSSLEALARANACEDALICVGRVDDDQRDALLESARVFAMPSRLVGGSGGEGFGIVYLEAGAHGTPVVAGDVGGARDAVIDAKTGVLVNSVDHIEIAEALVDLLIDDDRAARLGAAGRAWAERFEWPNVVQRVEEVLLRAAGGSS